MTKQQLIEKVAAKSEMGSAQIEVAVDSVFEMIVETLRSNERVDLRGFGSFVGKDRKERQGRNPRTGEAITIAAKRDASFKPGKELTEKLAQGETAAKTEEAARCYREGRGGPRMQGSETGSWSMSEVLLG
ncbi:MAG TPA: HU family DNA-binding protein [Bryobacteraceae bacterium]|jgi:nucleoid DNA-binding protein|nr:HU family DNA-binding protein [Bryobacteraceae bacterium]